MIRQVHKLYHIYSIIIDLGLSQICSKILSKMLSGISQKIFTYYALQSDCSIREYRSKELYTMHLSALVQFPLTTLLGSINLFSTP